MNPSTSRCSISTAPLYLTDFGMDSIMLYCDYVNTETAPDISLSFTTVHAKAALMFKNRFVSDIEFIDTDDDYEIFAKVRAEMKKKVVYDVSATISKTNEVKTAVCGCPGGSEPAVCKHSLALLYAVQSYSQKELYSAPTEQLQKWHQVKPSKTSPIKFANEVEENVLDDVNYDALSMIPLTSAIFDVLDTSKYDIDEAAYKRSVPLPLLVCTNVNFLEYPTNLNFKELRFFHENIKVSFEEAIAIEKATIQQNKCDEWKNNRIKRLTSSFFFEILKCKSDLTNLATKILNSHNNDLSSIPAVKHGIINEPLVQNVIKHTYDTFIFRKTGLIINPFFPYLGASPDGLLHNSDETLLIEIKCVFNPSNLDLMGLVQQRKQFCLKFENDKFSLKHNHKYMYQIQGQLAVSNLSKCLFALMYKQSMPLYTEEITFDNQLWLSMKNKLDNFYFKYYLPIIIN